MALLRNTAFLELEAHGGTGVFEFSDGFELTREIDKKFIMSERGQYLSLAWDQLADVTPLPGTGAERRTGYHLDGGAGTWSRTAEFVTGAEDESIQWGDGSSDDTLDASGANVNKEDRADVFEYWLATARTDSGNLAKLYYNQWSDGTYGDAGAHNSPMNVVIMDGRITNDTDAPSAVEGSLTMIHAAGFPDVLTGDAVDILTDIRDW